MKTKIILLILTFWVGVVCGQKVLSLNKYLTDYKLDWVTKVETKEDVLTISGYMDTEEDRKFNRQVKLKRGEVFTINKWGIQNIPSLMTIPYKVRNKNEYFPTQTQSGLNNIGINLSILQIPRYNTIQYTKVLGFLV